MKASKGSSSPLRTKYGNKRTSLVPPDIVLVSSEETGGEQIPMTLVSGKSCNDVIQSYELNKNDRRGSNVSMHSMVSVKGVGFDTKSRETFCWKCNKTIFTVTKLKLKPTGFALSIFCCVLCPLFAVCIIPIIMKHQNIVVHKCPICKIRLGSSD